MTGFRSKLAATLVLFFIGLMGGRVADLLHAIGGTVERGARVTDQIRSTVSTIERVDTRALEAQIAALQMKLAAGTATPAQIGELRTLVTRLRGAAGGPGTAGPPGPPGAAGPPGPPAAPAPLPGTTSTTAGGATSTTRPSTTTTVPTTTTTRCVAGVGRLVKIGC